MTKLQILDQSGHTTLDITDETRAEAERLFAKCLGEGGAAYRMDAPGKGTQIKSLGEAKDAPEVILRPQLVGG